jgi:hypothetical protein
VTRDIDEYKQLNLPVYGRGFIQQLFKSIEDGIVEAVRSGVDPVAAHDRVRYDMMTRAGYKA